MLVATGLVDEYPDIPGLRDRWGRDVVHCPFCFGWELRDQPLAVLATGPRAAAQALMWRQWSENVTLFLHTAPQPGPEQVEQLAARGISLIDGEVTGVEVTSGVTAAAAINADLTAEDTTAAVAARRATDGSRVQACVYQHIHRDA